MSRLSYWERRQIENIYRYMEQAEIVSDDIAKLYYKSSLYLRQEMDRIFEKYRGKHGLSEPEAKRLLNSLDKPYSLNKTMEKLRNAPPAGERRTLLSVLEAPAYRARLEGLQRLQQNTDALMRNIYHQEKQIATQFYLDLAQESYYRGIFEIQQRADAAFPFVPAEAKTINQIINGNWSGQNYSKRIWHNTHKLAEAVKEELLLNLLTGRTNREAAENIAVKFAQGSSAARRLIRTESNFVSTELSFRAYEEAGIERYQYLATLDLKTCEHCCRGLDGKIFAVKDKKIGMNCPPMHPWCRCTTVPIVDGALIERMQRSAIDPTTGARIRVPRSMTYQEWYEEYVASNPKAQAEEKILKNQHTDRAQYEKYRQILPDEIPKSFDKFQNLKYNNGEKWSVIKKHKQEALNRMDFVEMKGLIGKLGNRETRSWYKAKDAGIERLLDKTQPLKAQAERAVEMRNQYRTQARELMKDQVARKELDTKHPNKTFEELVEYKKLKYGLTGEDVYKDIIRSSGTTNKRYDKLAGIKEESHENISDERKP